MRNLPAILLSAALAACATTPTAGSSEPAKPVRVLAAAAEAETGSRTDRRPDVEIRTETGERNPLIVARGETRGVTFPAGTRVFLAGDATATAGIDVDNVALFELVADGKVTHRFVVGFHDGLTVDGQEVDNLGRNSMRFEGQELDVTRHLPGDGQPYDVRVTVLDISHVGRASELWLVPVAGEAGDAGWKD